MRRDEQADRLLLDGEQLSLVELLSGDRRMDRAHQTGAGSSALRRIARLAEVEDRALPDLCILLHLLPVRLRVLEHVEHAFAARATRAAGAPLDQSPHRLFLS